VFTISGANSNASCTATETSVASGYTKNESGCQSRPLNSSCTIVNTLNPTSNSFTVYKDFSDNNAASVSVSLTCTSGSVTSNPRLASEGTPAVFNITGASAGATCTAVESPVPAGYTANQSGCQSRPLNSSCTIVNTASAPDPEDMILDSGFETGQADGWPLNGNVQVDSSVAIGNYSLMLVDNGATSQRNVSTAGYSNVSVTMHLAGANLQKNDACYAELSTNGGSTWTQVLKISNGQADSTFRSNTLSPAAASNNANLRLRFRTVGKGKGDYCWGDQIIVSGTPLGGSGASADNAGPSSVEIVANRFDDPAPAVSSAFARAYESSGFDPGFDHLVGDGRIHRSALTYESLASGQVAGGAVSWSTFAVPGGAAQPGHLFEGSLELRATGDGRLSALPDFRYEFVQIGNHLYPQGRAAGSSGNADWSYVIDTGRVWREQGDGGFSRAAIPFLLVREGTDCARKGAVTFLFDDTDARSQAAVQLAAGSCAEPELGLLEAVYTPASLGNQALETESVMSCAADAWLPLVQGRGGITMMLSPDDQLHYVMRDAGEETWLKASSESAAVTGLCD
jgi:hypothetical protein